MIIDGYECNATRELDKSLSEEYSKLKGYKFSKNYYIAARKAEIELEKLERDTTLNDTDTIEAILFLNQHYRILYLNAICKDDPHKSIMDELSSIFYLADKKVLSSELRKFKIYSDNVIGWIKIMVLITYVICSLWMMYKLAVLFEFDERAKFALSIIYVGFFIAALSAADAFINWFYKKHIRKP